ncbi:helix-turn-helix domain-containing protein [Micromonospora narathiwatensis]|uniref:Helix-turn-helix domain-containing protein n=1 Tax=Micromonospora narathiwatensis TaxID=299146 RepID=A0A1A9A5B3_9ACTN|nr:helix-turn-helix transcriptional regulator [Micromonospora narathiwatensis]SBT51297.1 Helix-turn-helix domain-containing protein [Micromonospora narathiwatensis]
MTQIPTLTFLRGQLRRARQARGLNQEDFGKLINYSSSHVSAIEIGDKPVKPDYLARVDAVLETGGLFVTMLELIRFHAAPDWFRPWEEIEREAITLRWYDPTVIPGLLQTEGYARAMLALGGELTADEVEARVAARLARQAVLTGDRRPQFVAVLEEQTLRRQVGDRAVMREQLTHLLAVGTEPHVQVRIVPADAPWHIGLHGPFILARLGSGAELAHLDNQLRGQTVDGPNDVAALGRSWETVTGEALPRRQSTQLIEEVAKSWT